MNDRTARFELWYDDSDPQNVGWAARLYDADHEQIDADVILDTTGRDDRKDALAEVLSTLDLTDEDVDMQRDANNENAWIGTVHPTHVVLSTDPAAWGPEADQSFAAACVDELTTRLEEHWSGMPLTISRGDDTAYRGPHADEIRAWVEDTWTDVTRSTADGSPGVRFVCDGHSAASRVSHNLRPLPDCRWDGVIRQCEHCSNLAEFWFAADESVMNDLVQQVRNGRKDLSNADLTGADLSQSGIDLTGADLSGADLTGACLTGVDLTNADLTDVDLSGAYLVGADLRGANLTNAALRGTNLYGANLANANLTNADLYCADLNNADLTNTILPDTILDEETR